MSPELINPERFGFEKSCPTKSSDCYALGMVVYETISGNLPFYEHADLAVFVKVLEGKHPTRGMRFTNSLWKMLELCWACPPKDRPTIEDVLRNFETGSNSPVLPPPEADEEVEGEGDDWTTTDSSSRVIEMEEGGDHQNSLGNRGVLQVQLLDGGGFRGANGNGLFFSRERRLS